MKFAGKTFITLLSGIILGSVLLSLVYLLPLGSIRESAARSLPTLEEEGIYPQILIPSLNTWLDNYTDAVMLDLASYDGAKGIVGAMDSQMSYGSGTAADPIEALKDSLEEKVDVPRTYERYWHGYLVLLKPLMYSGVDYDGIRAINAFAQAVLLLVVCVVFIIKRIAALLPPLLAALLSVEFFIFPFSMQFSSMFYIGLLASLFIAFQPSFLRKRQNAVLLFLTVGMVTNYVDFLTYPIFALGIPAVTYLYLYGPRNSWKRNAGTALLLIVAWFIGYGGMWVGKWLLASLVLQENVFANALAAISFRTSMSGEDSSAFSWSNLVQKLLEHLLEPEVFWPVILISAGCIMFFGIRIRNRKAGPIPARHILGEFAPYAIIAAIPILWLMVIPNHAFIHNWMTYRNLSVCIYALLGGIMYVSARIGRDNATSLDTEKPDLVKQSF